MRKFGPIAFAVIVGLAVAAAVGRPNTAASTSESRSSTDQCARSVSERTGNWFCVTPQPSARRSSSKSCDVKGCWAVATDFRSTAYMSGSFGYGKKPLGMVYLSARHTLDGATMYSREVRFNATVKVKDLHATGSSHANVLQVSWSYGDYPGYWFAYQKSAIADDPNRNRVYGFNTADYRFLKSAVGGYRD